MNTLAALLIAACGGKTLETECKAYFLSCVDVKSEHNRSLEAAEEFCAEDAKFRYPQASTGKPWERYQKKGVTHE